MTTVTAAPELDAVLAKYERKRQYLIPILQDVQDELKYLSEDAIHQVADYLGLSANDVFGVATFYTQFRFIPPGRHHIKVCQGTACHVRGSGLIIEEMARTLHIAPGETTDDREYSLERVACYGSCALAPVVIVDDRVHGRMDAKKTTEIIERIS
ncbi:MAG: NADH-quinone oxidoreductase subunit NuoE [Phycisphaerales bacterium]|nr:NADH-quinone oxidoreductase subunit NuoE [Phycisphaerales bacterium]